MLGYVQEARAEQAVAALQRMAAATASVVRDGREQRIAAADVVPGDILLMAEGDAVSADGRLIEAASLTVAEAALTGESEAVLKDVATITEPAGLGDRVNMVFAATAVTRGRGRAVVTATGMATEMGNVASLLGRTEEQPTPLQREVDRVGRMLGIAVIAIAAVVVTAILLTADIRSCLRPRLGAARRRLARRRRGPGRPARGPVDRARARSPADGSPARDREDDSRRWRRSDRRRSSARTRPGR